MSKTKKESVTDDEAEITDDDAETAEEIAINSWAAWIADEKKGKLTIDYDADEDVYLVKRDGRKAVIYTSDIDEDFYGDSQAIFVETEIGEPPANLDWSQTLKFSGSELVLSRISLTPRHNKTMLIVEGAMPLSTLQNASFDLLVKEVATIGRDLRRHLAGVMNTETDDDDE